MIATPPTPDRAPSSVALVVDPLTDRIVGRAPVIDSLRALACLMVIACHAVMYAGFESSRHISWRVLTVGEAGVALFFVISGYLVAGPFARALVEGRGLPAGRPFLLRRAARIFPGWWVAFGVAVLALPLLGLALPSAAVVLTNLGLVQGFFPWGAGPLGVGWTLCLELAFYAVVPVVALAVRRWGPATISADALIVCLAAAWVVLTVGGLAQTLVAVPVRHGIGRDLASVYSDAAGTAGFLALFIPGILASVALLPAAAGGRAARFAAGIVDHPALASLGAAPALAAAAVAFGVGASFVAFAFLSLAMGVVFLLAITHGPRHAHRLRLPARVGLLTYGLYLYHTTIAALLERLGVAFHPGDVPVLSALAGWLIPTLVLFALTLPVALLSWRAVERPLINLAARRSVAPARAAAPVLGNWLLPHDQSPASAPAGGTRPVPSPVGSAMSP